jgi:hypothetical protein
MADPGSKIRSGFRRGKLTERDFKWLADFVKKNAGSVELQSFTVYEDGSEAFAVLSVHHGFLGELAKEVADKSDPVPFKLTVLSYGDSNPGDGTATIGWGGGK